MKTRLISIEVGTTESGKKILYKYDLVDGSRRKVVLQDFGDARDYFDVYAVFEYLSMYELRKYGSSEAQSDYEKLAQAYLEKIGDPNTLENIKRRKKFNTSVDVLKYGRKLVLFCYRDPNI